MNRRYVMLMGASASLMGFGFARMAAANLEYAPGLVDRELAAGKTVFVDFRTSWCTTCAAQGRAIETLKAENPAYEKQIVFVSLDWDIYADDALSKRLNIPRRSTLVMLRGDAELGRIVAGTSRADIKALLDLGLS